MDTLCPQIKRKDIEAELGFDLNDLVNTVSNHYDGLNGRLGYQLRVVKNIVSKIDTGLITFDRTVYTIENFMWFVPGLLFVVSLLASVAAFGVLVAWKEKSGTRVQRIMSYFILPMLIIVSLASWIVVICASVGTMVGSGKPSPHIRL